MFNNLKQLWARSSKLRYLLVGLFNTGIAFLLYAVLVSLGMNFAIANFIALCFGILFSYQTIKRIVFETKDKYTPVRYLILWVVLFLMQISIIAITIHILGSEKMWFGFVIAEHIGGAVGMTNSVILGYILQKNWVFKERIFTN